MTSGDALRYLGVWSGVGAALFSVLVVVVFRTGIVWTARTEDGTLKEQIPLSGLASMMALLLGIIGLQVASNYFGLALSGIRLGFFALFLLNFAHYGVLFLYDTLVIDYLVLSIWRPRLLRLPDSMTRESMHEHIFKSLLIGTVAGAVLSAASALISYLAFMGG